MLFDTFTYAADGLENKPYAWYFIQYDLQEYLKSNYPKVNYVNNYVTNVFTGDDDQDIE
jgi:hypothetical protein